MTRTITKFRLHSLALGCALAATLAPPAEADTGARAGRATPNATADKVVSATLTRLHTFNHGTDGLYPGPVVAGANGNAYGYGGAGGANGYGTLYRIAPDGSFSILHSFTVDEGSADESEGGLVAGPDGSLYGMTRDYQAGDNSVVFRISPSAEYSVVYRFPVDGSNGAWGQSSGIGMLTVAADGSLYGTKPAGGAYGSGVAFKIDPAGDFTLLHSFTATDSSGLNSDGDQPVYPAVASDGTLFGLASYGGAGGRGTIFRIAADGSFSATTNTDLVPNYTALMTGHDGNIYGYTHSSLTNTSNPSGYVFALTADAQVKKLYTAALGIGETDVHEMIAGNDGNLYAVIENENDAIVKVTPSGAHSIFHKFDPVVTTYSCTKIFYCTFKYTSTNFDGIRPLLSQDAAGNIYGTGGTEQLLDAPIRGGGGVTGDGTVFRIAPDGTFTLLYTFDYGAPLGRLAVTSTGTLLGVSQYEGQAMNSSVYSLTPAGPMTVSASFSQATAKVGDPVTLTWSSTGATSCNLQSMITSANGPLATSGSMVVTASSSLTLNPPGIEFYNGWLAQIQCTAADGSEAGYALQLTKH